MKNAEMKVVKFSAEDVIATSGLCALHTEGYLYHITSVTDTNSYGDTYSYTGGKWELQSSGDEWDRTWCASSGDITVENGAWYHTDDDTDYYPCTGIHQ